MEHLTGIRVLRLNIAGTPIEWLNWQQAACLYSRDIIAWTLGEPLAQVYAGTNRRSGLRSSATLHGIIACRGPIRGNSQHVASLSNQALFNRDHHHCLYCGLQFKAEFLTRDHVIPTSKGGAIVGQI